MSYASLAYALAAKAHEGQTRRGGVVPYIMHIDAAMVRAPQDDISQAVVALHDTKESDVEHYLSDDDLRAVGLPEEVIEGRDTLTHRDGEGYEAYIRRIKETSGGKWVPHKVADILANLSDRPSRKQIKKCAAALLVLLEETPVTPWFYGRCPRCNDVTEVSVTPREVACKWGGCNGTVQATTPVL